MSPDPVTQAPENGQNYDRYTYALNNPLRYSDPNGFTAANPIGTNMLTVCGGPESECGSMLANWLGSYGVNEVAGYDSLDGLLDYHLDNDNHHRDASSDGCTGGLSLGAQCWADAVSDPGSNVASAGDNISSEAEIVGMNALDLAETRPLGLESEDALTVIQLFYPKLAEDLTIDKINQDFLVFSELLIIHANAANSVTSAELELLKTVFSPGAKVLPSIVRKAYRVWNGVNEVNAPLTLEEKLLEYGGAARYGTANSHHSRFTILMAGE